MAVSSPHILIVDDNEKFLETLKENLTMKNFSVDTLSNSYKVESMLTAHKYNCILMDVMMPGRKGDELLKIILQRSPATPVIMISGESDIPIAVQCLKEGAYDFIEKSPDMEKLWVSLRNAITKQHLQEGYETLFRERQAEYRIIGESVKMKELFQTIQTVAVTSAAVLITGETGTGKELVARAIHDGSDLKGKPFVSVNCAAIPPDLLESELFGHKKGVFTGAVSERKGKFMEADGGTIFLDEIGELDSRLQPKLLRVLQEGEIDVIGENIPPKIEVRIIAATNKNLEKLVLEGKFRQDLFYRLNVVEISIPALRDRIEDIPSLADYFLKKFSSKYNKQVLSLNRQAIALLMNHTWPGNVRELEHLIERLVVFAKNSIIGIEEVQKYLKLKTPWNESILEAMNNEILPLREANRKFEKSYILNILNHFEWKKTTAANALKVDRSNLFKKMRDLGINE